MKLSGYLRVSSESQVDGYGLDVQEKAVRGWVKANGHRLVALRIDPGLSGSLPAADRPGLSASLYDIETRRAEGIIVPKLDRLAREVTVQEATLALVWRMNGHCFTADSGEVLRDDPDDPMRTAMRQMAGVFNGLDRRLAVKRMRDGRRRKAEEGKHAAGQYAYGMHGVGKGKDRDAGPNPAEAAAVALILARRRAGDSYREICRRLDAGGHKPRYAANWNPMTVSSVAKKHGLS